MYFILKISNLILSSVLLFLSFDLSAQNGQKVDWRLQSNRGTLLVREIKNTSFFQKDSSVIVAKFFMLNCIPLKQRVSLGEFVVIDNEKYMPDEKGELTLVLKNGVHFFCVESAGEHTFFSLRQRKYRFKKGRTYIVNVYLVSNSPKSH